MGCVGAAMCLVPALRLQSTPILIITRPARLGWAGLGWAGRGGPTFSCATFSVLGVDRGWARRGFTIKSFVLVFRRGWQAPGRHCATVTRHFFCWSNCQERGRAAPAYKVASSCSGGQPGFQCSGGVATNPEEILAHLFCMKKRHIKWCVAT